MCYNIDTVRERNKPKTKKQKAKTLYRSQVSLPLTLKSGKSKMKRVDPCTTKIWLTFARSVTASN
jgi:hypothetical protein